MIKTKWRKKQIKRFKAELQRDSKWDYGYRFFLLAVILIFGSSFIVYLCK